MRKAEKGIVNRRKSRAPEGESLYLFVPGFGITVMGAHYARNKPKLQISQLGSQTSAALASIWLMF